jgi:hypothetical protein
MLQFFLGDQYLADLFPTQGGGRAIAVNQPTGGGNDYPFIFASDLNKIIADAYIYACGGNCNYTRPFSIDWLYGFGDIPAYAEITPIHDYEARIVDADGREVFNSLDADFYQTQDWSDRLRVIEWKITESEKILRLVKYLSVSEDDDGASLPLFYRPEKAIFDDRIIEITPPRVRSVSTVDSQSFSNKVVLSNGHNTRITVQRPTITPGQRPRTVITFNAAPGAGLGRFDPGCEEETVLKKINGVGPDDNGNIDLTCTDCYRLERPIHSMISEADRTVSLINHSLHLLNDCSACCTCGNFINTYEGFRRIRDNLADLFSRAHSVRDTYNANVDRWNAQRSCRLSQSIQAVIQPTCSEDVQLGIGFCNHSSQCLDNLVLIISFQYADGAGDIDPVTLVPYAANTSFSGEGDPDIVCGSTLRAGNFEANPARTFTRNQPAPYPLGGAYPYFYAFWDRVQPGGFASMLFKLSFPGSGPSDTIEAIVDAYSLPNDIPVPAGSTSPPVPGYVFGSGPMTAEALSYRVSLPYKLSSGILPTDCCD